MAGAVVKALLQSHSLVAEADCVRLGSNNACTYSADVAAVNVVQLALRSVASFLVSVQAVGKELGDERGSKWDGRGQACVGYRSAHSISICGPCTMVRHIDALYRHAAVIQYHPV